MKKSILLIFILLLGTHIEAQKSDLDALAIDMFKKVNERNFDALMDMTYPAVFDVVPKDMMISSFKSMFEGNDDVSIDLPELEPNFQTTQVYKTENSKIEYAFMNYDLLMSMTFKNQEFDQESQKMMIDMIKAQGMDATFESKNKINVNAQNRVVILLKDDKTNNEWKMINYDPNSPFFVQILPAEIIEKAKSHHMALLLASKKK